MCANACSATRTCLLFSVEWAFGIVVIAVPVAVGQNPHLHGLHKLIVINIVACGQPKTHDWQFLFFLFLLFLLLCLLSFQLFA